MKVLIAEDDPVSRKLLQVNLEKWGYEVVVCQDGRQAWDTLQEPDAPCLALLDWMMPGKDGAQLCREIRQQEGRPYVYLVLLTAKASQEDMIAGLDAGADDYLTKPFDRRELELRLRTGRRILDLQAELIAAREALRVQATHDVLTGLWNRRAILEALEAELSRSRRQGSPLGLIVADLDHFKAINDCYGHTVGDAVLREAARRMRGAIRPYDGMGRYGGEEFLIVLPGCDSSRTAMVAERLRTAVSAEPAATSAGPIAFSASFGVVSNMSGEAQDAESFIHAADQALYRAKSAGRNCVVVAPSEGEAISLPVESQERVQ